MDLGKLKITLQEYIKSKVPFVSKKLKQTGGSIGLTVRNLKEKGIQGFGQHNKSTPSNISDKKYESTSGTARRANKESNQTMPEVKIPEIDYSKSDTPPLPPLVQLVHLKQLMVAQQKNSLEEGQERKELELEAHSETSDEIEEAVLAKFPLQWNKKRGVLVITNTRLGFVAMNEKKMAKGAIKATTGIAASGASRFGSGMVSNLIGNKLHDIPIVGTFLGGIVRRQSRKVIKKGFSSALGGVSKKYLNKKNIPSIGLESIQNKKHDLEISMAEVNKFELRQEKEEGTVSLLCTTSEVEHTFTLAHEKLFGKVAAFFRKYAGKRSQELKPKVDFVEDQNAKSLIVSIVR